MLRMTALEGFSAAWIGGAGFEEIRLRKTLRKTFASATPGVLMFAVREVPFELCPRNCLHRAPVYEQPLTGSAQRGG